MTGHVQNPVPIAEFRVVEQVVDTWAQAWAGAGDARFVELGAGLTLGDTGGFEKWERLVN